MEEGVVGRKIPALHGRCERRLSGLSDKVKEEMAMVETSKISREEAERLGKAAIKVAPAKPPVRPAQAHPVAKAAPVKPKHQCHYVAPAAKAPPAKSAPVKEPVVVILSGGMDSTTLLYDVMNRGYIPHALTVNYAQRHVKEIECAKATCEALKVTHKVIDLSLVGKELLQGSSLTSDIAVPEGHYSEKTMKATVVPNRNMILLSLAIGYAISIKAKKVFYGAHAGDHAIYPDCRNGFVTAMKVAAGLCDWNPVDVLALYQSIDKGDIVVKGLKLGVDYSKTWTCYKGGEKACGKCGSCVERILAFFKAKADDPVAYEGGWASALNSAIELENKAKLAKGEPPITPQKPAPVVRAADNRNIPPTVHVTTGRIDNPQNKR
jgi:7-cyano-7-deazaguanine synthase